MSRSVRLVLAAALAAAFTLSSVSSSGAFVSSQPGVHDWLFDTSDLARGLFGHLFNGYDARHVRSDLRQVRHSADRSDVAGAAA